MKRNATISKPSRYNRCLFHVLVLLLLYTVLRLWIIMMECPTMGNNAKNSNVATASLLLPDTNERTKSNNSSSTTCSTLQPPPSALAVWTQHIDAIVQASRLPPDQSFTLRNKVMELLRLVTPRLLLGQSTWTRQWSTLERLFRKLEEHDNDNEPISIVVFGGSVTMGVGCFTVKSQMKNCAWPYRLEHFLRQFHSNVRVYNLAIAGSNTATGTALLSMLPDYIPQPPDIIINAYSTNDMHVQTVLQAQSSNRTIQELVFDMSQTFVRAALSTWNCFPQPLLIWLDDYLGNEQPQILATTQLTQSIHVLAQYYGFSFVSYANVARDLVYADTHESLFSPGKWYATATSQHMQREIHPSQSMHMVTAWLLAYHFLVLTTRTCTLREWHVSDYERTLDYHHHVPPGLSLLNADETTFPRWPRMPRPVPTVGLPPFLTPDLTLEQVTDLWRTSTTKENRLTNDDALACSTTTTKPKCPLVWVSGIPLLPSSSTKAEFRAIQSLLQNNPVISTTISKWTLMDDTKRGDKLGWMPEQLGAQMIFQWPPATTTSKVTLFYLKSYGPKWEQSTIQVTLESTTTASDQPQSFALTGFHDKKTSEMYIHHVEPGSFNQMTLELVKGITFKLMGVAICIE